jgi:hypothetical protein
VKNNRVVKKLGKDPGSEVVVVVVVVVDDSPVPVVVVVVVVVVIGVSIVQITVSFPMFPTGSIAMMVIL